jgi:hypothetical protein
MYNISLIGIVILNPSLCNEYILIKSFYNKKRKVMQQQILETDILSVIAVRNLKSRCQEHLWNNSLFDFSWPLVLPVACP